MLPDIDIGLLLVPTHDFFLIAGVLVACLLFAFELRRAGDLDHRLVVIAASALLCGAVGAKFSTVWRYLAFSDEPTLLGALVFGGKSILGGLAGAYAGVLIAKRLVGYSKPTGDYFVGGVALGMAVGRWGCFFTEQLGTPTNLPWALTLSDEAAARLPGVAAGVPSHPSFLYEIAFHAAAFVVVEWLRPRVSVRGDLFKLYLLAYAVFRFGVEFVRGNEQVLWGLSFSQLFLIPSSLLLGAYFIRQRRVGEHLPPPARVGSHAA